jgi:signal transduction histidine kinase
LAEIGNLKTIIGRFSDFAKMPAPQFEATDVNELVRDAAKLFGPQLREARSPIELKTELAPDGASAPIDVDQVRRALRNLILNAMDAMPDGGTLTIQTERIDDGIRLAVADTGQGLSEEECARLFTPYYTTKSHGTGLGLAIVQSVVSDHGGKISVSSAPGGGARFQIDFPARRA